jgi:hypothetical protein
MLEDYRFSEDMSYASHRLMVRSKDIKIGGVLGPVFGISVAEESPPVSCAREFRERDSFLSPLSSFPRHRMLASLCRVRRTSERRILCPLRRD